MKVHTDPSEPQVTFDRPFRWVQPAADETGAARFEALVRYYLCIKDVEASGIRSGVAAFKEHFQGACCDVAEHLTFKARKKGHPSLIVRLSKSTVIMFDYDSIH